jgi:hypothetical protein
MGLTKEEADKRAEEYVSGKVALHNPDQVAGGFYNRLKYLGDLRINSSLGAQWGGSKQLVRQLDTDIMQQTDNKQNKLDWKLNVDLIT